MSADVARRQTENKKKMQEAAKRQVHPDHPVGPRFRNTPAGRRLAALGKKKPDDP